MKSRVLILLLACCPLWAGAQDAADTKTAAEPPQYYQVELIVFRHLDQSRTTGEIPRMPEPEMADLLDQDLARLMADPDDVIVLKDAVEQKPVSEVNREGRPPGFIPANPNALLLEATAKRLEKLEVYEVVSYFSWGQTAPDVTAAEALPIDELGADRAQLSGTVELHQRRYLHLALEILLDDAGGFGNSVSDSQLIPRGRTAVPAIKDSRRVRLEEIQYFDQPGFGVLAVVSRMPTKESAASSG